MSGLIAKLWAFFYRDLLHEVSYRVNFLFQLTGSFFFVTTWFFISRFVAGAFQPPADLLAVQVDRRPANCNHLDASTRQFRHFAIILHSHRLVTLIRSQRRFRQLLRRGRPTVDEARDHNGSGKQVGTQHCILLWMFQSSIPPKSSF